MPVAALPTGGSPAGPPGLHLSPSRLAMQFAKLFELEDEGQLLVQVRESTAREFADQPYHLVFKTMTAYGATLELAYPYALECQRDAEFARLDEREAAAHLRLMHRMLHEASTP